MDLDSVLKKLRKLQKLYDGAKAINSEGEAANAAALIQKLLTEYNLTMAEIQDSEKKENDGIKEEFCSGWNYPYIEGKWEHQLWYVICKYNFCKCFQYGNSYKRLVLFGKKENLEIVKWLHDTLAERYVEFSRKRFHEYEKTADYKYAYKKPTIGKFQRSYLLGVVKGLESKLEEISNQDKAKDKVYGEKVTALVVRTNTDIDTFINNKYGRTTTSHHTRGVDGVSGAYSSGMKDGYNTDIHKPIQQNQHKAASGVKLLS